MKNTVSRILAFFFLTDLAAALFHLIYGKNYIRALNYHSTFSKYNRRFEEQLQYYQKKYTNVTPNDLALFFETGNWPHQKPGLIISFDDGCRTNYDFARPLLEKYNFTGYFFIATDLVANHRVNDDAYNQGADPRKREEYPDNRFMVTWEELKHLADRHFIGSHSKTHHRFTESDTIELLQNELIASKNILEEKLQIPINSYAWVGGEFSVYTKNAFDQIAKTYEYSFMTNTFPLLPGHRKLFIQRTNVESFNPLHLIKFQLCGLMDLYYYRKRKRIAKKLKG